mmetsp:Transcript_19279/g.27135  ORF Transcript_19279/g.27135 Transcript_19279/m.27135 type:complete len:224 (-) Transcript_19279:193-864(-)|eukprot:CAMPEP_0185263472 /NCGR_PEP_ID=MMETSP1359-20130426/15223_1 /TAXON_ID=552665 /ORGANISM="Bigelowiella longifila, Strain CCMP242" /LENGTH=223 /DNA_ID=CAMNT_0027851037 /DNA_START=106 /DNA_END=777 /DNA_ORIENTATION=-
MAEKQKFQNKKHKPTEYNQAGAILLEDAMRKSLGDKLGKRISLDLPHQWKGTLVIEFSGDKGEFKETEIVNSVSSSLNTTFEGKAVNLEHFALSNYKKKKTNLVVDFCVFNAAKTLIEKRSKTSSSSKGGSSKKKKGEKKQQLRLQPRSIADMALYDLVEESLKCLTEGGGVSIPEGKQRTALKEKLQKALRPTVLTFQNRAYAMGHESARGTQQPPHYNLFE